jgi:DNA-binding NarL/FixJ family response regulator
MEPALETTIVVAEDQAMVREGLAALCANNGIRVLAQCADGRSAIEAIESLKPEFALLDVSSPELPGVEVVRRLRAAGCASKLIILAVSREQTFVTEALRAGADAYLLKDGPARHLLDAISFVREGGVYVSPLLHGAGLFTRTELPEPENPLALLSPRETEVFRFLVNGLRAKDIAELLDISPKTVDTYRAGLMRKLKVRDLVSLVKFAIENKLAGTSGQP